MRSIPACNTGMDAVTASATKPRRTKPRGRHPDKALSAAFIRSAPPGRHADGNGLFLYVKPEGTRSWIQRLVIRGRRRELGLGAVALVSLAEARDVALANRKLARSGGDPLADKRRAEGVPTFAEAARGVVEQKQGGWRGKYHAHNWLRSLERYAFPRIGKRPVSEVNSADVLEILAPIWHSQGGDGAGPFVNACGRCWSGPWRWSGARTIRATASGRCSVRRATSCGTCGRFRTGRWPRRSKRCGRRSPPRRLIKLAFEFLVLTAGRSAEVRLATWDEMDVAGRVWTISAERMKAKREHRVPLERPGGRGSRGRAGARRLRRPRVPDAERPADRRVDVAEDAPAAGDCGRGSWLPLVVPGTGRRSGPTTPREVIEAALAHVVPNKVEAAYARSGPVRASAAPDGRLGRVRRRSDGQLDAALSRIVVADSHTVLRPVTARRRCYTDCHLAHHRSRHPGRKYVVCRGGAPPMKRHEYLHDSRVAKFIEWLGAYVRGDRSFEHSFRMLKPVRDWRCSSLWEAHKRYEWNGGNFDANQAGLERLAACLRRAVEQDDQFAFVETGLAILRWGGVTSRNAPKLRALGEEALPIFHKASHLLEPSHADTSRLSGVRYMNSGWTKVYALMLDGLPMYDGRVGAAMGYLVQKHCTDVRLNSVPDLLHFRWGQARGDHNRDPSSASRRFKTLTSAQPGKWAECNVRAAWVLGEVCGEGRFGKLPQARRLRALEAALFMIGYELPIDEDG